MTSRPDLTVTSHALLGQLALRPWSIYEMTRNIGRTLHWFWPRAESVLYAEVKRLTAAGLAKASPKPGRRGRDQTIYSITAEGRKALREWLGAEPGGSTVHSEPLVRVHLSPYGTKLDLVNALEVARAEAEDLLRQAIVIGTEFAAGEHQFQEQVHIRAILFDCLWSDALTRYLWAERSLETVGRWRGIDGSTASRRAGVELINRALAKAPAGFRRTTPTPAG